MSSSRARRAFLVAIVLPAGAAEEEKEESEGNTESTASKNMSSNSAAKEASKTWNGRKEVVNIMFMFFDVVRCVCLLCVCVCVCLLYCVSYNEEIFQRFCLCACNYFFLYILYL